MREIEWARRGGRSFIEPSPVVVKKPSSVIGGNKSEFPEKIMPPKKTLPSPIQPLKPPFSR